TDLRVAHLAGRQAGRLAGGLERRVRIAPPEVVEDRRLRQLHGVAWTWRRAPEPVEDDQCYEREAVHIATKESTSSDAPPTSAPSTEGWCKSSAAFSGLTEPP